MGRVVPTATSRSRATCLQAPSTRLHQATWLAGAAASDSGCRPFGTSGRVLARRGREPVVRRRCRRLGEGSLLARWRHSARLEPGRRAPEGEVGRLHRPHRVSPAARRLVPAGTGGTHEADWAQRAPVRHVGDPADAEGAGSVPRRHGRGTGGSKASFRPSMRSSEPASRGF